ncbi:MAG: hypothetical protein ACC656_07530, partial [Candidatus Heimdallarchaeota archaeon]
MSVFAILNYGIIALALIPTSLCLYYYMKTELKEYLFVGMAFIFGIITVYIIAQPLPPSVLLFNQIESFSYVSVYFFFLLYAMRINWDQPPKIAYLGVLWYVIMIYFIFSYQPTSVNNEMEVLFIKMKKTSNAPSIVGIYQLNGVIISGKGFEFIYDLFRVYVFGLILYMYLTANLPLKTSKTMKLWGIWIVAVSVHLLVSLLQIGNSLGFWEIQIEFISLITFLTLIIVAYIAIWHPEAFLITHTQLIRAF